MARSADGPWFYAQKQTWYATLSGKKVSLKVKGEGNEAEAVKAWHRLMAGLPVEASPEAVQGKPKPSQSQPEPLATKPKPDALTLPELVDAFLADAEARIKAESLRGYRKFLTPFSEAFAKVKPDALTVAAVERFYKGRKGWSQSYRNGFVGTVVSLFRWAVDSGKLERNPVQGIRKPPKQSRGRKALVNADDHAKLVRLAKGDFGLLLRLLWLTGCRPGELTGLTAADVDLLNRVIVLTQHKTEATGKDRLIVLTDEAVSILRGLISRRPEGLLFPGQGGKRLDANNVSCRMSRLCKRAGAKATAYGHRHSFATDALSQGVPDAVVAGLLGHQGTGMLHKHYSHLTSRTAILRDALAAVRR